MRNACDFNPYIFWKPLILLKLKDSLIICLGQGVTQHDEHSDSESESEDYVNLSRYATRW